MLIVLLQLCGLAAVIVVAGTALARCADAIAEATGLGRLVVGSVLLAAATSLPELTVDLSAIRLGLPDLAVGDLFGSSLMNLLILAAIDLLPQSSGKMLSRSAAAHALSGLLSIALTGLAALALLTSRDMAKGEFLGVHVWVWLIVLGYGLGVRAVFIDQRIALRAAREAELPAEKLHPQWSLRRSSAGFVAAASVILVVGPYLAKTAGEFARLTGLGESFVGTTLVALSTSLPELVATLAAVRIGAFDLAVGNVFGSNAFNMVLLLPLDAMHPGPLLAAASSTHAVSSLAAVVATSTAIMGQLYQAPKRWRFLEPDAWLVMAMILGALTLVYANGNGC